MAGRDETWSDAEDTGSLSVFRWDHCDLLLDAVDIQLDQLQIQPPTENNHIKPATLRWSKDTRLGSTTQTNDTSMSCLELIHTPMMRTTPGDVSISVSAQENQITAGSSFCHDEIKKKLKGSSSVEEEVESEGDLVTWRLQRLLGDVCQEGTAGETHSASDSICTEDFFWCFREEMVDLSLSEMGPDGKTEISESDTNLSSQNRQVAQCEVNVSQVREGAQRHGSCSKFSCRTEVITDHENVSSDSDVDAVCTEQVKQHVHKWTGPFITDLNDFDTTTQDETERLSALVRSSSSGRTDEAQSNGTKTSRKEASTPGRTSEKTDWKEMKFTSQRAVQHLSAGRAQIEEKKALESLLGEGRTERESISNQLQKQRESCLQIQKASPHKQILDEECKNKKQNKVVTSEMAPQLDCTQTELFVEQRRAREKTESLQQRLEETCEELHGASEAESSLGNGCLRTQKEREKLKRELQNLKPPNHTELKGAQEQTLSEKTVLQQEVQLAVRESDRLWAMLEDKTSAHKRFRAETEQQLRLWAQQLAAELKHLHLLVEHNRDLPQSFTVAEAVAHLRTTREQLQHFVRRLHQQLDSQKQMNEQLRKEKEQELRVQRQQLRAEKDQALNSMRRQLIREHVEELSCLKWAHVSETGGVAACLRRQLQDKDLELRQVQRSMAEWRRRTAARLASQFEHQLTAELERCKVALMRSRRASKTLEARPRGGTHSSKETVCSHRIHAVNSAAAHISTDVVSLKLLRHLQGKVKQLRVETQAFLWSPNPPDPPVALSVSEVKTLLRLRGKPREMED
nr:uncharacterized protein si:ch211-102c2.8 isoform X2 [Nothobranchius furzeri]